MIQTYSFPSIIEVNNFELRGVASELIHGLKIHHDDNLSYIIGNLAVTEGIIPHKTTNSSPDDTDYRLLAKAAMLVVSKKADNAFYLTTGFPFLTYQLYRQKAQEFFQANHTIKYDPSVFSNTASGTAEQNISVVKAMIIPELVACDLSIRKGENPTNDNYFLISLGYGTFEAALSTPNGLVQRTTVSGSGIRYAIAMATKEFLKDYNIGFKAEHQFDQAFATGRIVLNRTVISIEEIRKKYLQIYYNEVISPLIAKSFSDKDFAMAKKIILVGGGSLYTELQEMFFKEFGSILEVSVQNEPTLCAAKGYCLHSRAHAEGYNALSVGVDIGNANTILAFEKGEQNSSFSSLNDE